MSRPCLDTLEGLEGEFEDKADNYAKIIRMLKGNAEIIQGEEARLYARRKTMENRIQRMKEMLQASMEFIGKTKFKTALFSFSVAKNGGSSRWKSRTTLKRFLENT